MTLSFNSELITGYKSPSQIARILTEDWLFGNMYCPICGAEKIDKVKANAPVKDYICGRCNSQYELKSKKIYSETFQSKVNDGAYQTMIDRITSLENPHFFFMHYDNYMVNKLILVPKYFFTPSIIEKRKPLSVQAQRANWEGCNILLSRIPNTAKIHIIRNGKIIPKEDVIQTYNHICSLKTENLNIRGWLLSILHCVELLDEQFTLKQIYGFIPTLRINYPSNNNIEAKIRQQLQLLRDKGFIEFIRPGVYRKIKV